VPKIDKNPSLQDSLHERIEKLESWLNENAPMILKDQTHLDEGTRERAYWNYGYLIALQDVVVLIEHRIASMN
jgi:hypothetical protein